MVQLLIYFLSSSFLQFGSYRYHKLKRSRKPLMYEIMLPSRQSPPLSKSFNNLMKHPSKPFFWYVFKFRSDGNRIYWTWNVYPSKTCCAYLRWDYGRCAVTEPTSHKIYYSIRLLFAKTGHYFWGKCCTIWFNDKTLRGSMLNIYPVCRWLNYQYCDYAYVEHYQRPFQRVYLRS